MVNGGWKMVSGGWVEDGEWKMGGEWRMVNGGW